MFNLHTIWTKQYKQNPTTTFSQMTRKFMLYYIYILVKIPTGLVCNALNQFQSVSNLSGESKAVSFSSLLFTSRLLCRSPKVYEPTAGTASTSSSKRPVVKAENPNPCEKDFVVKNTCQFSHKPRPRIPLTSYSLIYLFFFSFWIRFKN